MRSLGYLAVLGGCLFLFGCTRDTPTAHTTTVPDGQVIDTDLGAATTTDDGRAPDVATTHDPHVTTLTQEVEEAARYRQEIEQRLIVIQQQMDQMNEQMAVQEKERSEEAQASIDRLKQRLTEVRQQLADQRAETAEALTLLRDGIDAAVKELETSAEAAQRELSPASTDTLTTEPDDAAATTATEPTTPETTTPDGDTEKTETEPETTLPETTAPTTTDQPATPTDADAVEEVDITDE
jgi:chromosome segregation ATPase